MGVFRFFYSSACHRGVTKNALAALRKKTGCTFANCRKALELHNNDEIKVCDKVLFHEIIVLLYCVITNFYLFVPKNYRPKNG